MDHVSIKTETGLFLSNTSTVDDLLFTADQERKLVLFRKMGEGIIKNKLTSCDLKIEFSEFEKFK